MAYFEKARVNMVKNQLEPSGVYDAAVLLAFATVPRETFVPAPLREAVYLDDALPLGAQRYLAEPRLLGKMLHAAAIRKTDKVLDIACGTGYSSALLSQLAKSVVAVESVPDLAEIARRNLRDLKSAAELFCTSLAGGYALRAPYDLIFINGAIEEISSEIVEQMAPGGRLYAVQVSPQRKDAPGYGGVGQATCWTKMAEGQQVYAQPLFEAAARPLAEFAKKPEFSF